MFRGIVLLAATLMVSSGAIAQSPAELNPSEKAMLGTWEFSNAARSKICNVTFGDPPAKIGFQLAFDTNCANLFPLVGQIVSWRYPENDLLYLLDATGKALVEFSEVEDGMFEAPTPGIGVLFLHNPDVEAEPDNNENPQGGEAPAEGENPPDEAAPPGGAAPAPQPQQAPAPKNNGG